MFSDFIKHCSSFNDPWTNIKAEWELISVLDAGCLLAMAQLLLIIFSITAAPRRAQYKIQAPVGAVQTYDKRQSLP